MGITKAMRAGIAAATCAFVLLTLVGCGGGGGGEPAPQIGRVASVSIASAKVGYTYNVLVYLPDSYDKGNASLSYPTVYALDGDAAFDGVNTRFANFMSILQRRGTDAILIGISGTVRRQTDFNFPGATAYHDFLTLELVPAIEARFRANPKKRMLCGLSTSGNLAATALLLEAPNNLTFSHFLSAEGAFWQQLGTVQTLEQQMFDAAGGKAIPATLILARSNGAYPATNFMGVSDLYQRMLARNYVGLQLLETVFNFGHVGVDDPSFEDAIARFIN